MRECAAVPLHNQRGKMMFNSSYMRKENVGVSNYIRTRIRVTRDVLWSTVVFAGKERQRWPDKSPQLRGHSGFQCSGTRRDFVEFFVCGLRVAFAVSIRDF